MPGATLVLGQAEGRTCRPGMKFKLAFWRFAELALWTDRPPPYVLCDH